jgi:MFS family permease
MKNNRQANAPLRDDPTITPASFIIWLLVAFFFLYEFFLRTLLNSLVHDIMQALRVSTEQLSLIDIAYAITYGAMQLPVGLIITRFGIKRGLLFAICACASGIALLSIATGFYVAFASRLLIGVGSSFAFISLLMVTFHCIPVKKHGLFFGLAQGIGTLGPFLAGAPLMMLTQALHHQWRKELICASLAGFLLMALSAFFMKKQRFSPATTAHKTTIFAALKPLLLQKKLRWLILYAATNYVPLALLGTLWGTTYLETYGLPPVQAAFIASMLWCGLAIGAPLFGLLSDITQQRKPALVASAALGLVVSLILLYVPDKHAALFFCLFFLLGVASAGQSIAFLSIAESVNTHLRATALGLNNACISFSIAVMIPAVGFIIQHSLHQPNNLSTPVFHTHNFTLALTVIPVLYCTALLIALFRPFKHQPISENNEKINAANRP